MDRTFNPYTAPQTGSEPPRLGHRSGAAYAYEDQQRKVTFVGVATSAFAIALVATIVSNQIELSFLAEAEGGHVTEADGEANDARQFLVFVFYLIAWIGCIVAIASFLHRANKNARALAGDSVALEYTPGWTVGWFFVPVLSLWKPYRAVQEMFRVSHYDGNGLLGMWWASWILMNVVGRVSQRLSEKATEIDDFVLANNLDTVHSLLSLVATGMVWAVVRSLHRLQRFHHESGSA